VPRELRGAPARLHYQPYAFAFFAAADYPSCSATATSIVGAVCLGS
jgi:hypothetical protein